MKKIIFGLILIVAVSSCKLHINSVKINTLPPNVVRLDFQVDRQVLSGKPKPYFKLKDKNFIIYEDKRNAANVESQYRMINDPKTFEMYNFILLDNTQSIDFYNLELLKNAVKNLIQNGKSNHKYAIAVFSGKDVKYVQKEFINSKDALASAIDKIELGESSTNLFGATEWAFKELNNEMHRFYRNLNQSDANIAIPTLIIFTDGGDNQGTSSIDKVLSVKKQNSDIKVVTIGVKSPETDFESLKRMSSSNSFYMAANFKILERTFAKMQKDLNQYVNSFYYLEYLSTLRGDKTREMDLLAMTPIVTSFNSAFSPTTNKIALKAKSTAIISGNFNAKKFFSGVPGIMLAINSDFDKSEQSYKDKSFTLKSGETTKLDIFSIKAETNRREYEVICNGAKIVQDADDKFRIRTDMPKGGSLDLIIKDKINGIIKTKKGMSAVKNKGYRNPNGFEATYKIVVE